MHLNYKSSEVSTIINPFLTLPTAPHTATMAQQLRESPRLLITTPRVPPSLARTAKPKLNTGHRIAHHTKG